METKGIGDLPAPASKGSANDVRTSDLGLRTEALLGQPEFLITNLTAAVEAVNRVLDQDWNPHHRVLCRHLARSGRSLRRDFGRIIRSLVSRQQEQKEAIGRLCGSYQADLKAGAQRLRAALDTLQNSDCESGSDIAEGLHRLLTDASIHQNRLRAEFEASVTQLINQEELHFSGLEALLSYGEYLQVSDLELGLKILGAEKGSANDEERSANDVRTSDLGLRTSTFPVVQPASNSEARSSEARSSADDERRTMNDFRERHAAPARDVSQVPAESPIPNPKSKIQNPKSSCPTHGSSLLTLRDGRKSQEDHPAHDKPKVLVVDDNRELLATTFDILNHAGCETDLADSGYEAIARCQEKTYDVVVLDIMMPGLNGVETLRAIRSQHPHTRFIVMTGYSASKLVSDARSEGIVDLFIKPVNPACLVRKIKEIHPTRFEVPVIRTERPVYYHRI